MHAYDWAEFVSNRSTGERARSWAVKFRLSDPTNAGYLARALKPKFTSDRYSSMGMIIIFLLIAPALSHFGMVMSPR